MKLRDLTTVDFINKVDEKSATPGGGSVSALASSLGVALTKMVGHLSVGKKKFRELDEDVKTEFNDILDTFKTYKEELIELIDKDTEAYNMVMAAFKLPKETEEEINVRKDEIEKATIVAIETPYRIAVLSLEALKELDYILQYGNKNTLSDLGVSALMLYTGLEGALLNVKINIPGLRNVELAKEYSDKVISMLEEGKTIKDELLTKVHNML